MDPLNVIIILIAALLVATIAHKLVLSRYSDALQAEIESTERARARPRRPPSAERSRCRRTRPTRRAPSSSGPA